MNGAGAPPCRDYWAAVIQLVPMPGTNRLRIRMTKASGAARAPHVRPTGRPTRRIVLMGMLPGAWVTTTECVDWEDMELEFGPRRMGPRFRRSRVRRLSDP